MSKEQKRGAAWVLRTVQSFVIVCVLAFLWQLGEQFDGVFFPVVSKAKLISVTPLEDGGIDVQTSFMKLRECDHIRTDWFIGRPGRSLLTTSQLVGVPDQIPAPGELGTSHRVIRMSEVNFLENSYAVTTHDCYHGWLWETHTLYWNASKPTN